MSRRNATMGSLSDCATHLRALLTMKPGSALLIRNPTNRSFLQLERGIHPMVLILDFPLAGPNEPFAKKVERAIEDAGVEYSLRDEVSSGVSLAVLRAPLAIESTGGDAGVEGLLREILRALDVTDADEALAFEIAGETDTDSLRRVSRNSLERMASSRIPILNALARRELEKLDQKG